MKFKCDENLPQSASHILRSAGYDTSNVWEEELMGCKDIVLIQRCKIEERILISLDLDFSDIRTYPPGNYPGIVILRLKKYNTRQIIERIRQLIAIFSRETPEKKLWIVEKKKIRVNE